MKISPLNFIAVNNMSFCAKRPENPQIDINIKKIENALEMIENSSDIPATVKSLSDITGLPENTIYHLMRLSKGENIHKKLRDIKHSRYSKKHESLMSDINQVKEAIDYLSEHPEIPACAASIASVSELSSQRVHHILNYYSDDATFQMWQCIRKTTKEKMKEDQKEELEQIMQAIQTISNSDLKPTVKLISDMTGISDKKVRYRIFNQPIGRNALKMLKEAEEKYEKAHLKAVLQSQNSEISSKSKTTPPIIKEENLAQKRKMLNLAMKKIRHALYYSEKLSYAELERLGLTRAEIDKLISDYAKYLQEQRQIKINTKKERLRWEEEHRE